MVGAGLVSVAVGSAVVVKVGLGNGWSVGLGAGIVAGIAVAVGNAAGALLGVGGCGELLQAAKMPAKMASPPRSRVRRIGIAINIPLERSPSSPAI